MASAFPARPEWVPDNQVTHCLRCHVEFTLFVRKHHCRACGKIFCGDCCDLWLQMPREYGYVDPQRLCGRCYKEQSTIDFTRTYDEHGAAEGNTVLLVHGSAGNRRNLLPVARDFAAQGYRVLSLDLPGHGSRYAEELNMTTCLRVLYETVAEKVPSQQVMLVGYNLGAFVSMAFAGTYGSMVCGLVLMNVGTDPRASTLSNFAQGLGYALLGNKQLHSLLRSTASSVHDAHINTDVMNECFMQSGTFHHSFDDVCATLRDEPFEQYLERYAGRVLLLHGQFEDLAAVPKWADACAVVQDVTVRGAGPMLCWDRRFVDQVFTVLRAFADALDWAPPITLKPAAVVTSAGLASNAASVGIGGSSAELQPLAHAPAHAPPVHALDASEEDLFV